MAEYFYNVTYLEYENGKVKNTDRMLIRSTSQLNPDKIKSFIRGKLNNPAMVITLAEVQLIDKDTFVAFGGEPVAPWFKGNPDEKQGIDTIYG